MIEVPNINYIDGKLQTVILFTFDAYSVDLLHLVLHRGEGNGASAGLVRPAGSHWRKRSVRRSSEVSSTPFRQGLDVHLVTITDASVMPLELPKFNAGWKRLRDNLQRAGLAPDHFVSILDYNPATRGLHRHVLTIGGPPLTPRILQRHAQRAGLGHIDRRAVEPTARSARDLAAYVARNALHFAIARSGWPGPISPVSRSR